MFRVQRRVNPKIHDVIKKEVEKLLDAGLIYPISDSPWVSPVHCVPKKSGITVIKNDDNELIPTDWSRCGDGIDDKRLNEATQKTISHFPSWSMLRKTRGNNTIVPRWFLRLIFRFPLLKIKKDNFPHAHNGTFALSPHAFWHVMAQTRYTDV
ncbi:hypothetical protein Tco_0569233 [Tanacetum coccineum]